MKFIKSKYFRIVLAVVLALCVPSGVFAVKNGISPKLSTGGYYSKTENRMDFSLDATEFVCEKKADGKETYVVSATLSLRKCEPDLYAVIKRIDIADINCNYILFTADTDNETASPPENLVIRDNKALSWKIEISVDAVYRTLLTPELQIEYASGLTADTADEHLLDIPLKINIV